MQVEALRQTFVGQLQFEIREVGEKSLMTVSGKIVFLGTFAIGFAKVVVWTQKKWQ